MSPRNLPVSRRDLSTFTKLRIDRFAPYAAGMGPTFTLTTYATGKCDTRGCEEVAYQLSMRSVAGKTVIIFRDRSYYPGAGQSTDGNASIAGLMSFLTLREGDTDSDYFANYDAVQLAYAAEHGETLSHDAECELLGLKLTPALLSYLARQLRAERDAARNWLAGREEDTLEVRLQITDSGDTFIHAGSACYDTDHSGVWGASEIPLRGAFSAIDMVRGLWNQCVDGAAADGFDGPCIHYAR